MEKAALAGYLVSLHTLINAQTSAQSSVGSKILAAEYDKHWALLKDTIKQENESETRSGNA